jgi:hypothetical protein
VLIFELHSGFGLGFNAVYHLTDVPSFITRGPEIPSGGTFCVFDPHCWHVPIATTDSPGMKMKLCKFESKYESVFQLLLHHLRSAKVRSILNDLLDSLLADLLTL